MKTQRRAVLKGLVASAAGVAGMALTAKAGAKNELPQSHEVGEVVEFQQQPLFSKFTKYGNLVFISGIGCKEGPRTIKNHTEVVMRDLKKAIEEAGSSMDKVLKCYAYVDDIANYEAMNKAYDKAWPKGKMPARTSVAVAKGGIPGNSMVEVDAICYI
jgi:enamine deaminase RidA (YjgF/YER057c/UK114 family)